MPTKFISITRIMHLLRKLSLNLGLRAWLVLGTLGYIRLLFNALIAAPAIVRSGDFKSLDRRMGRRAARIRFNDSQFRIDCHATDRLIQDGTYTFGLVRELYVRNCYLRFGVADAARKAKTVIDFGANRGLFSVLMVASGAKVVSIEANPDFERAVHRNMEINGFSNFTTITAFVGAEGRYAENKSRRLSVLEIMALVGINRVDLMKIDIEGSEFAIFREASWLDRVDAVTMEIHPEHGNPGEIIAAFAERGFTVTATDNVFRPVKDYSRTEHIYAWKAQ